MVTFRALDSKAGGKGFGLLAMGPTSDLSLPLSVSSLMGVQTPNCTATIGQPMASYRNHRREKEMPWGPHLIGQSFKTMALSCTSWWGEQMLHSSFLWLVSQSMIVYYYIMTLYHTWLNSDLSNKLFLRNPKSKLKQWPFQHIKF